MEENHVQPIQSRRKGMHIQLGNKKEEVFILIRTCAYILLANDESRLVCTKKRHYSIAVCCKSPLVMKWTVSIF